jgi:Rrf2 family protein
VDLTLTKRGDYVLRAATDLAGAWSPSGTYRKIRDIAADMGIPPSYTPSILGLLARAGIAESKAGRLGGYRLRRPPKEISVLEVIEAAEGPLTIDRCPMRGGPCRWDDACAFHPTWSKGADAMRRSLARTSLARVAADDAKLSAGEPLTPAPPPGHRRVANGSRA